MSRVVVVFNKWWEFDPGFACLLSDYARPPELKGWWPRLENHPRPRINPGLPGAARPAVPRAVFTPEWGQIDVWCISDLLEHLPDKGKWQSSSERKAERLPDIFSGEEPRLVIAVGTASAGDFVSLNGAVVVGTKCFLHNSRPDGANADSNWRDGPFDQLLDSSVAKDEFDELLGLHSAVPPDTAKRFLPAPLNPARDSGLHADYAAVALANVNVTDYKDYDATDADTLAAFRRTCPSGVLGSLETTHGLIRALGSPRFVFVSGIVDRLGHFHEDVDPRPYAQNTVGAHNAGVAAAWLLSRLRTIL
jgi:hypothetical protein